MRTLFAQCLSNMFQAGAPFSLNICMYSGAFFWYFFFCSNYGRITQTLRIKCPSSEFFGTYFPAFELNTENHFENLRFQSNYEKIQTRKTPKMDPFYAIESIELKLQNTKEYWRYWSNMQHRPKLAVRLFMSW